MKKQRTLDRHHLPEEIMEDIFSRLPTKTLMQFRCVSKSWQKKIRTPSFIKLHCTRWKTFNEKNHKIMVATISQVYSLDCRKKVLDRVIRMKNASASNQIWGSSNGIICFTRDRRSLHLWNPCTGDQKQVPDFPLRNGRIEILNLGAVYGFCYNENVEDYEIIRILPYYDIKGNKGSQVDIYSLRKNFWVKTQNLPYAILSKQGELVRNALHWVRENSRIIAFDIGDRTFREVPLPNKCRGRIIDVVVLNECLCVVCDDGYSVLVYKLEEYGVSDSWRVVVQLQKHSPFDMHMLVKDEPLCFGIKSLRSVEQLAMRHWFFCVTECPLKAELVQDKFYTATTYVETIVTLP